MHRHPLLLQLPLPVSLIHVSSLWLEWICNDRADDWITDVSMQVFKTSVRSGSDNNARCGAGHNATC